MKEDKLLSFLPVVNDWRWKQHQAVWENEKHFAWWVSVLLAAMVQIFLSQNLTLVPKCVIATILGAAGIGLSVAGFKVIRRESEYFVDVMQVWNRTLKALSLDREHRFPLDAPRDKQQEIALTPDDYEMRAFADIRREACKSLEDTLKANKDGLSVRVIFQLLFCGAGVVFGLLTAGTWLFAVLEVVAK